MFLLTLALSLTAVLEISGETTEVVFKGTEPPESINFAAIQPFSLCTYTNESFDRCTELVKQGQQQYVAVPIRCFLRNSADICISEVRNNRIDLVVLGQEYYRAARRLNLYPALFAREQPDEFYIAVGPATITYVDYVDATYEVDVNDRNAYLAAVLFNSVRGNQLCPVNTNGSTVRIVNAAEYVEDANDILFCPLSGYGKPTDVGTCNFNVGLQRAVFVGQNFRRNRLPDLRQVFLDILDEFQDPYASFNFFADDIIFKHTTVGFSGTPYYYNGISEEIFNEMRCRTGASASTFRLVN